MNYNETLNYLYNQMPEYQRIGHVAYKEGLENSLALDKIFNHPHRNFKTIHVGGTNGKSTTNCISTFKWIFSKEDVKVYYFIFFPFIKISLSHC